MNGILTAGNVLERYLRHKHKCYVMPEGPSIVILKELTKQFKGKKVLKVSGTVKMDKHRMEGEKITDIKTWGKHYLVCFKTFTLRVHFMLFGSYRINDRSKRPSKLRLEFARDEELNFYACHLKYIKEPLNEVYDWSADIMSDKWSTANARKKLKNMPDTLACDALLDQNIFAGSGNIIKNEVLFRTRIHPQTTVGALPAKKLAEMVRETSKYSFDFLEWKMKHVLSKHWQAYSQKTCPRCDIPLHKKDLGHTRRRTFFCNNCQELYK